MGCKGPGHCNWLLDEWGCDINVIEFRCLRFSDEDYIMKMKMGIVPTNKSCQRAFMSTAEITTIANVVEQPVEGFCEYLELLSV